MNEYSSSGRSSECSFVVDNDTRKEQHHFIIANNRIYSTGNAWVRYRPSGLGPLFRQKLNWVNEWTTESRSHNAENKATVLSCYQETTLATVAPLHDTRRRLVNDNSLILVLVSRHSYRDQLSLDVRFERLSLFMSYSIHDLLLIVPRGSVPDDRRKMTSYRQYKSMSPIIKPHA